MKNIIAIILVMCMIACKQQQSKLPYYDTSDFTPKWNVSASDDHFHKIRSFHLINQNGQAFTEKNMDGKICVVDYFFTTCPGICPRLTNSMSEIQKQFLNDDKILLMSHTATPETDSVPVLKQYAEKKGVNDKRWMLLTGNLSELYDLGRRSYFIEEDLGEKRDTSVFLHTENFVLVDKERKIRGIYNGLDQTSMAALVNDIKILEHETD